jgi:peptidoglycan hydrolase-like protein with peptidoglycan-binding domain
LLAGGVPVDGRFWGGTAKAVAAFQRRHGLTPDEVVGPKTLAALRKVTR